MERIAALEALGLTCAVLSDRSEGDCSPQTEAMARFTARALPDGRPVANVRQVHGTTIAEAGSGAVWSWEAAPEADGVVTAGRHAALGVWVADCVPIFLFDPTAQVAGLVHAGRRGTYEGVAAAAVRAMARLGADPAATHAHIGPSAGPCCYEVSWEIANAFRDKGLSANGRLVDLWESNRRQLKAAGLAPPHLACFGICTICTDRFHSYRREDTAARNLALMAL